MPRDTGDPRIRAVRDRVAKDLATHRTEAIDPTWGPESAVTLRRNLEQTPMAAVIRVIDVDCRTRTCAATIEWPSYEVAFRSYRRLLTNHYDVNCSRRMGVPPPEDPSAPYRAHLFLDCRTTDEG